jgi:hypothetical protein
VPGIASDTVPQFKKRIARFNPKYASDWTVWMATLASNRPRELKRILGRWQACRGNTLRDVHAATPTVHCPPYIDDLLALAQPHVVTLGPFDIRLAGSFTASACNAILALWSIFEQVSYARLNPKRKRPPPRGGLAGAVGISKAAMLVTDGRVGPAFDSKVTRKLGLRKIQNAQEWLSAIKLASSDIVAFESARGTTLQSASGLSLHSGRIYDMALGP